MQGAAETRALDVYHLIFAPTHACNLRCRHCYLPDHNGDTIPFDRVKLLVDEWEEIVLRDRGTLGGYFHLKGGEPLIVPYLVELLDLLTEKATLRFMMTTNGTILREADLEALCRLNEAVDGEVIIIVSLDGSCEETNRILRGRNQFAKTVQFARAIADAGLNLHFNYVVHSDNLDDVPNFVELAEEIGATQINFLPIYGARMGEAGRPDLERLHRMLLQLYREGDERRRELLTGNYAHILDLEEQGVCTSCECVAGYKGLFYITPDGNVYSCPNLVSNSLALGNFLETSLDEIHEVNVEKLYEDRIQSDDTDDRYLCRGERLTKTTSAVPTDSPKVGTLPVLEQPSCALKGRADPIRRLQDILVREGLATRESGRGVSYCFSRNF